MPPPSAPSISPELEEFIFHPDQFKTEDVPRGLEPALIARFIELRINALTPFAPVRQTEKVVAFYDVYEACDHLGKLLDKRESGVDMQLRSVAICRILARVGTPPQRELAAQYFPHLVSRADSVPVLSELVSLHEALSSESDPLALRQRVDERLRLLLAAGDTDAQARKDAQTLEKVKNVSLPRAHQANLIKNQITKMQDRNQRLSEEARVYLGLQYGFGEYLPAWAAGRLRRETWAAQPDQQLTRGLNVSLRTDVVNALRGILPTVDAIPKITDPEKDFIKVTAIKAIVFFGGAPSESENRLLNEKGGTVKAILSVN